MEGGIMKRIAFLLVAVATVAGVAASMVASSGRAKEEASPIFGVTIPSGYRDWQLISVTHEEGDFNQLRAQLGNGIAIKAYREGKLPFPDGSIIVALHWQRVPSDEDNQVFGRVQAFVAGSPVNMQVMVKDSKKYARTGGWGFGDFKDGKASDQALHEKCFPCHIPAKASDYVYTHYAP
jgi:Cytochrome P460